MKPIQPNPGGGTSSVSDGFVAKFSDIRLVTISGQVLDAGGRAVKSAVVSIVDQNGNVRSTPTNSLGYYSFDNVSAPASYMVHVRSKRYRFDSKQATLTSASENLDFIGLE
jgi:hypothetical protein